MGSEGPVLGSLFTQVNTALFNVVQSGDLDLNVLLLDG